MKNQIALSIIIFSAILLSLQPRVFAHYRSTSAISGNGITFDTPGKDSSMSVTDNRMALYDSLDLGTYGLSREAFEYALTGYQFMLEKDMIETPGILTICDFSQSSKQKRLYVIDLENAELLLNTYVAHGRNSGGEFARSFSNNPRSHQSSLGFYITGNTYFGEHGLSLRMNGMEKGINDKANARHIVVHGSKYVDDRFLEKNPFMGRSFGCPAVPANQSRELIDEIKGGTCFFIYHPDKKYLERSKILKT